MESLTSLQRMVLFRNLSDLSRPWVSLRRTLRRRQNAGWLTSIWQCDMVLVVFGDMLENWFWAQIWLQRPDACALTGHNPGLLLAVLLDIIPWEDIFIYWGWLITPHAEDVKQRGTSVHILHECEALASLRRAYLVSFFLDAEDIKSLSLGAIWNISKGTGLPWSSIIMGHKGPVLRPRCIGTARAWTQLLM